MEQNKKPIIVAVIVTAIVVAGLGAGGIAVHAQMNRKVVLNDGAGSISAADSVAANTNGVSAAQSSAGSLSAGVSSSAASLGQLGGSTSSGSQGTSQSGGSSSSGSSGASSAFDTATFAGYEKYKSDAKALFADVQVGTGTAVAAGSKVAVYYKGWLTNGQLFDQSRTGSDGKLQPFTFTMGGGQVINGWEQGIAGMKVGGVRLLIVPPSVGYGASAQGSIPANSVLVFEVQLLAVQ